jgi:hypothetical protein
MRDYRFRFYNTVQKKMVNRLLVLNPKRTDWIGEGEKNTPDNQDDHHEVMQYTGLEDKNSTQIYEGDILRRPNCGILNKKPNGFKYKTVSWNDGWAGTGFNITRNGAKVWEVIGNIYENPELLKYSR